MTKIKNLFKFFLISQLILLQISKVLPQLQTRIVGGTPTNINRAPYLVQLLDNGRFFCGGTLVSPRFVVTAAHCVKGLRAGRLTIVAGATTLQQTGVRSKVNKIMMPKGFNMASMTMDVAVLKLRSPITGRGIRPIGLCQRGWKPGSIVQVFGWGLRRENAQVVSNQLQTGRVKVIAKAKCVQQYRGRSTLTRSMFCASIPGRKDACLGDSGGPALINGQFCGIVSWGIGCARKAFPGVYTNVLTVRKFIRTAMRR